MTRVDLIDATLNDIPGLNYARSQDQGPLGRDRGRQPHSDRSPQAAHERRSCIACFESLLQEQPTTGFPYRLPGRSGVVPNNLWQRTIDTEDNEDTLDALVNLEDSEVVNAVLRFDIHYRWIPAVEAVPTDTPPVLAVVAGWRVATATMTITVVP